MEFMPNGNLLELSEKAYGGSHPPEWDATARSKAVLGIVAGMTFVHSLGILHGNLWLSRILLDGNFEVRIADLELASEYDPDYPEENSAGRICLVMAPEVIETGRYTSKADVYSFAVCLYSLFAPPQRFDDDPDRPPKSPIQIWGRVLKGVRFVRSHAISPFYWGLMTQCWQQSPEARPSFAEILDRPRLGFLRD
jgi:serine/threonine protein kinase